MKLKNVFLMAAVLAVSAAVPATEDAGWVSLRFKEAGMVFQMPAQPKFVDRGPDSPITVYALMTGEGLLMAGYSTPMREAIGKKGARTVLEDFDRGLAGSAKLTSAGSREVDIQGHKARVSAFKGKDEEYWRVVSVIRGDRIGFQAFIGPKDKMSGSIAAKFFNSLKLASQ